MRSLGCRWFSLVRLQRVNEIDLKVLWGTQIYETRPAVGMLLDGRVLKQVGG